MPNPTHSTPAGVGVVRLVLLLGVIKIIAPTVLAQQLEAPKQRPNILMIIADDMNWDSPGCFGGAAPEITPNLDQLASEGMRFRQAYANISICTPSRSVLLTGLYPTANGAEGFQPIHAELPNLPALLNEAGYLTGIIGKPLRQQERFHWSTTYRWQGVGDEDLWGRDPAVFRKFADQFFSLARASNQPFFLMASSHDPHRPFGGRQATRPHQELVPASRTYQPNEVSIPGFLPDLPEVRADLAGYCTSVRRLDDMVGAVLSALDEKQFTDDTLVFFLSDHGMPFPGAKFNCYPNSLRSPWIIRWPNRVKPGGVDGDHFLSTIDVLPTLLEAAELPIPACDGRSFLPILFGHSQRSRDAVFAQFHHIHGADALPMRSVITKNATYVFNPWANGKREFDRLGGPSFQAMKRAAESSALMQERLNLLRFRSVEEFYDHRTDPHCLNNLLPASKTPVALARETQQEINRLRQLIETWMQEHTDPAFDAFVNRNQPKALEQFVIQYRAQARQAVIDIEPYEKAQGFRF